MVEAVATAGTLREIARWLHRNLRREATRLEPADIGLWPVVVGDDYAEWSYF